MNPVDIRLSEHFLLSDFLGCHSVYTHGYRNWFGAGSLTQLQLDNIKALCSHALEPMLQDYGTMSISYGYVSPELSRKIVTYQDPDKPSHHRWDLGAAADVCLHEWINYDPEDDSLSTAPIALAHDVHAKGYAYSRLITYSESPFICIAVSAKEIACNDPRKAFYENRYSGKKGVKPDYRSSSTETAKATAAARVAQSGLPHGWRGAGYPTYHGRGKRQYHHVRTSKYTMLSDWLFDLQSIANGARNIPNLRNVKLWEVFCAAGDAYDEILDVTGVKRMSITSAFIADTNPYFDPGNDWASGTATFTLVPPASVKVDDVRMALLFNKRSNITCFGRDDSKLHITVQV